jgi:UDP-glucose 6-dehydrogenase
MAGAGHVGPVTAACLSEMGNGVIALDFDAARAKTAPPTWRT